jgi:hypothetical protein
MRWDDSIQVVSGVGVAADPIATPALVLAADCVRLPKRDPQSFTLNTRVIFGLTGVGVAAAETVSFEVYAQNDEDDLGGNAPNPAARWSLIGTVVGLEGGRTSSLDIFVGGGADSRGGLFYIRILNETTANNRQLAVKASPGGGGSGSSGGSDVFEVVVARASIIDNGAGAPVALADAYAAIGAAGSSAWINLNPAATFVKLDLLTAVATPTSVDLEVFWSPLIAAAPPAADYTVEPVVDSVSGGVELLAPRQSSWRGRLGAALPVSPPRYSRTYERPGGVLSYAVRAKRGSAVAVTAQVWATQLG